MELQNVELFKGVTCASIDAMMSCFRPEVRKFKKGDTILVFEPEMKSMCVLSFGQGASLLRGQRGRIYAA